MSYVIQIDYITGNSFSSEATDTIVDFGWQTIEAVKDSLQRIINHHKWSQENQCYQKPKNPLPVGVVWMEEYKCTTLELIGDSGKTFLYNPEWVGYFERLLKAEIVTKDDPDMSYIP